MKEVKRLPVMWDSSGMKVEQLEATSKDGTKIPFFVVSRDGLRSDGTNPTLLDAYGGFEVSKTPAYATTLGAAWLERGGRLRAGEHPRRRRVRPAVASRGPEGKPSAHLRRLHRRG